MQPYRYIRPHDPATCPTGACAPNRPGHPQCQNDGCDAIATTRAQRHATQAVYDALPEGLRPIDGVAHQRVYACDDCDDDIVTFCRHPMSEPAPCPACHAAGADPCIGKKGGSRPGPHAVRAAAQPPLPRCTHAHREDCGVFTGCVCTGDDPNPVRAPRIVSHDVPVDTSGLTVSPREAALFAIANGIDLTRAVSVRTMFTQDNRPAFAVDQRLVDGAGNTRFDRNGREMTETVIIPLDTAKV